MTNEQHPITPPPIVREQWQLESPFKVVSLEREDYMIDRAAQWGADQELEAMMARIEELPFPSGYADALRAACRPKPPSLKEQALERLELAKKYVDVEPIRLALEALDD